MTGVDGLLLAMVGSAVVVAGVIVVVTNRQVSVGLVRRQKSRYNKPGWALCCKTSPDDGRKRENKSNEKQSRLWRR